MDFRATLRIDPVSHDRGSILIIALFIMAFLTLLGVSITTTSTIEVQISANDRAYKRNFYLSESAAMEAVQRLENETDTLTLINRTPVWLHTSQDMITVGNWDYDGQDSNDNAQAADANIDPDGNTHFSALDLGIAPGSSLSMGGTNLHEYAVYGLCNNAEGRVLIEVGYRKRF